jgi:hypothetical protein
MDIDVPTIDIVQNTLHFDVGVTVDGFQGNYIENDKFYAYIIPARTVAPFQVNEPCVAPQKFMWNGLTWKHLSIEEGDILYQGNDCRVKATGVLADMVRLNREKFGVNIDVHPDGDLIVPTDLAEACVKVIRDAMHVDFVDVTRAVQFHRVDGLAWDDPAGAIGDPNTTQVGEVSCRIRNTVYSKDADGKCACVSDEAEKLKP